MKKYFVEVIGRFRTALTDGGKSELTAKTYAYTLQQFADWLATADGNIANPTRHDVQSYVRHLQEDGKSAVTIEKTFASITAYALWLNRSDVVQNIDKPTVRKQRNVAPKSLERNDRNRLLRDVERHGNLRDIAIVYTLLHCGLRVSEATALDRDNVHMFDRKGHLVVRHGKGGISRDVPLSKEVRHHLARYLNSRRDNNPALFVSRQGRITARMVQYVLKRYDVHPHMLRHTFCRELVNEGVDIASVAELAGHADINVTRRYSKPTYLELERAIDRAFS